MIHNCLLSLTHKSVQCSVPTQCSSVTLQCVGFMYVIMGDLPACSVLCRRETTLTFQFPPSAQDLVCWTVPVRLGIYKRSLAICRGHCVLVTGFLLSSCHQRSRHSLGMTLDVAEALSNDTNQKRFLSPC